MQKKKWMPGGSVYDKEEEKSAELPVYMTMKLLLYLLLPTEKEKKPPGERRRTKCLSYFLTRKKKMRGSS